MTREVKAWWDARAGDFQRELDLPVGVNWTGLGTGDLELLGEVAGVDVLELGCGGGQCTVALAERGADVVGVDLSAAQLTHARALADERGVDVPLVLGDVTDLPFRSERFDVAFNAWVFQWVGDLAGAFAEARRVLRSDGRFVFSMPHPFYELIDPETGVVEGSYFETGRYLVETDAGVDQVLYRHRVSDVFDALVGAGFRVERMLEPGSADPEDYESGPWGEMRPKLMAKVPTTLVFDARAK